ncbi:MAG: endonuclease [Ignavibacteria bacterium]|nr:endonuclease [Ignavibacteria bacterium]
MCSQIFAQYSPQLISLDTVLTKTVGSKSFYLKNPSAKTVLINNIRTIGSQFYFTTNNFSINPYDSVLITVYFSSKHNITYRDFLIFENTGLNYPVINYSLATGKYPDTLYIFTQGLIDEQLKTALNNFTSQGYTSLGYNLARDKMFEVIDDYGGDTIECVYTGTKIKAVNRTEAQNQGFDTEHTYPQSYFNSEEPMRSDIYHLYPTLSSANNARSNYHFGFVVSNITWQMGGSKRGFDYQNEIVFEARDVHKGNVARSLLYFVVRYGNLMNYMLPKEESVLKQWNNIDTVDARELLRNQRIKSFQNVYNPFIAHPEFIERIKSFSTNSPTTYKGEITVSPFSVVYDTLAANDTASYYLGIINYGNAVLNVSSLISDVPQFIVEDYPASVPAGEVRFAKVKFKPTAVNQTYSGTLTINNSDSAITVNLKGFSNSNIGIKITGIEIPAEYFLYDNYPNPFNPSTTIKFDIPITSVVSLEVYDIRGKFQKTLFNSTLSPGTYTYSLNMSDYSSGVYYLKLSAPSFHTTQKLILIK